MYQKSPLRWKCVAFSLTELLVVICIIALLAASSMPAITALGRGSQVTHAASTLAGLLEQAREYAVAQNTYVWVGFYQDTSSINMSIVAVASKDGTNLTESTPDLGVVPNASVDLIYRVQTFKQVQLKEPGDAELTACFAQPLMPATSPVNALGKDNMVISVKVPGSASASPIRFTRVVQFTPTGSVRNNSTSAINLVEFGLQPKVAAQDKNSRNVVVMRINGFTGLTQVYRP